jgi:hypothetical protein
MLYASYSSSHTGSLDTETKPVEDTSSDYENLNSSIRHLTSMLSEANEHAFGVRCPEE